MVAIVILIASLVADLAVGLAAYKMGKAAQEAQAANTATNATVLQLLARSTDRIDNHEVRIIVLEHRAAA